MIEKMMIEKMIDVLMGFRYDHVGFEGRLAQLVRASH